jgi:hypothetical protein
LSVVRRLRRRSSAGRRILPIPARDWYCETRHVDDRGTRSPSSHRILDVRGIDGRADLVAADRAERESAVYSGVKATLYARFATQSCPSRRPQGAAEMGGEPPFPIGAFVAASAPISDART